MARLLGTVKDFPKLDFSNDSWEEGIKREEAALAKLQAISDALPDGQVEGGIIRFQIADGYAFYRIAKAKPLCLEHIPWMDGYEVDPALIRGLRLADVQSMLRHEKALHALFAKKAI